LQTSGDLKAVVVVEDEELRAHQVRVKALENARHYHVEELKVEAKPCLALVANGGAS